MYLVAGGRVDSLRFKELSPLVDSTMPFFDVDSSKVYMHWDRLQLTTTPNETFFSYGYRSTNPIESWRKEWLQTVLEVTTTRGEVLDFTREEEQTSVVLIHVQPKKRGGGGYL
jgi:hypothetical protein